MVMHTRGLAQSVPNSGGTEPPKLHAPANAADCHIHIYDPRCEPRVQKLAHATVDDLSAAAERIGLSRVVIVMPRNYLTDNSVTLDAIEQLGRDRARGVAVVRPKVTQADLQKLDAGAIRGIRSTVRQPQTAVVTVDIIEHLAKPVADLCWDLPLNMESAQIAENAEMLRRLPSP